MRYSDFFDVDDGMGADAVFGPGADGTLYTDQPTMFAVQLALQRRGFNPGTIDGIFGPRTETAIAAFNAQRGSPKMGPPDLEVLHALGLQPGGYQWNGAGVAPGNVVMTPSNPSTPPHIPGTVAVAVPPGTLHQVGPGAVQLQPQGGAGGGPGKAGGAGGVLGFIKKNAALLAGGVGLVLVGSQLLGGSSSAPRRRARRRGRR